MSKDGANNSWIWKAVVIGGLLVMVGLAGAVGIGSVAGGGNVPNLNGATNTHPYDPTDAKTKQFVAKIQAAVDPVAFLKLNSKDVKDMQLQTQELENYWGTDEKMKTVLTGDDLKNAKTYLATINSDLEKLLTYLNAAGGTATLGQLPSQDDVMKIKDEITSASKNIDDIVSKALGRGAQTREAAVARANDIISRNNGGVDAHPPIPYAAGMNPMFTRQEISNGTYNGKDVVQAAQSMDCAGFISYVLISTGTMNSKQDTIGLVNDSEEMSTLDSSLDTNGDGIIQESEVTLALGKTLLRGDIIITGMSGGNKVEGGTHAVMLLNETTDDPHSVGQSTDAGGKHGPQWTTIKDRMSRIVGKQYGADVTFLSPKYH